MGIVPAMPTATADVLVEADQDGTPVLGARCHARTLIEALPVNAQAAVLLALTTPSVKTVDIVRVLNAHGLPARAENLGRHRRRLTGGQNACKCPRPSEATTP